MTLLVCMNVGAHEDVLLGFIGLLTAGTLVRVNSIRRDLGFLVTSIEPPMNSLGGFDSSVRTK
jgi:hypothetical protein